MIIHVFLMHSATLLHRPRPAMHVRAVPMHPPEPAAMCACIDSRVDHGRFLAPRPARVPRVRGRGTPCTPPLPLAGIDARGTGARTTVFMRGRNRKRRFFSGSPVREHQFGYRANRDTDACASGGAPPCRPARVSQPMPSDSGPHTASGEAARRRTTRGKRDVTLLPMSWKIGPLVASGRSCIPLCRRL